MKKKSPVPDNRPKEPYDETLEVRKPGGLSLSEKPDPDLEAESVPVTAEADAPPEEMTADTISETTGDGVTTPANLTEESEEADLTGESGEPEVLDEPVDIAVEMKHTDAVLPEGDGVIVESDTEPPFIFSADEPVLFYGSDELVFEKDAHDGDPDLHGLPAVRISSDSSVFEPHVRKLSWLKPRHIVLPLIAVAVVLLVIFVIYIGPKNERAASPLMIRGIAISNPEFSFTYHFVLLENGIDIWSKEGRDFLTSRPENGFSTYRDFFLDMTAKEMQTTAILYDDAIAHGFSVDASHTARAQDYLDWLSERALAMTVNTDTYIKGMFGSLVTKELILEVLSRKYFTEDYAYGAKLDELRATEDQAEEAYLSAPNQYDEISYRLLRIVFEQKEDSFIATAHLHAREIIEKIGRDQSKFEWVASEYFSGDAKEKLMKPDSTLISNVRYNDVGDPEWRVWLFDPIRKPGDCIVYEDDDGFPILICFSSRQRQLEPLRNVRIFKVFREDPESGFPGIPEVDLVTTANIILHSVTDEASFQALEKTHAEDIAAGNMTSTHAIDIHRGKLDPELDSWIFNPARKPGDKTIITTADGIAILFYVESSNDPEWYDRINSFIRINNFDEFLLEQQVLYPYKFNDEGLKNI